MSVEISDLKGGVSSCCGAAMYTEIGICAECGEHCDNEEEVIPDDELDDDEPEWDDDWDDDYYAYLDDEDEETALDE